MPRNFKKIDLSCLLVIAQKRGRGTGACYLNCTQMRTSLGGLYSQLGRDFAFLRSVEAWGAPMGHSAIEQAWGFPLTSNTAPCVLEGSKCLPLISRCWGHLCSSRESYPRTSFWGPSPNSTTKGTDFEAELGTLHKPLTFYRKVNTLPSTSILEGEIKGWLASKGQRLL